MIEGWFDFAWFYDRVAVTLPTRCRVVEVGTWLGASTAHLAGLVHKLHSGTVFAVDTFTGADESRQSSVVWQHGGSIVYPFLKNMAEAGVLDTIRTIPLPSVRAATLFPDHSLDFVYIDASHEYKDVKADIAAWAPKVKHGSMLAGHDYDRLNHWVVKAVNEAFPDCSHQGNVWWTIIP